MLYYAPAKINLSLDITSRREDGYHNLCMIMQTVSLYDEIYIEKYDRITLDSNKKDIPLNDKNLAWKAADLFFKYTNINGGCKIYIKKIIPDGAGLGGGSSDAAEVLIALNEIYEAKLSKEELQSIALKIGADVPFFIVKGTCLAEGIGEKLTSIENDADPYVLIYKPEFSISTKWVYENLDLNNKTTHSRSISNLLYNNKLRDTFANHMFNVLEDVSIKKYSEIEDIKNMLKNMGAEGALMTGSGSAVFGIFYDEFKAKTAFEFLKNKQVFLTKFI